MMGAVGTALSSLGQFGDISPVWGWLVMAVWVMYQLYWPFWETKIQIFHNNLARRLYDIEIVQVSIAEEVENVDADRVKEIHDKSRLSSSDVKEQEA